MAMLNNQRVIKNLSASACWCTTKTSKVHPVWGQWMNMGGWWTMIGTVQGCTSFLVRQPFNISVTLNPLESGPRHFETNPVVDWRGIITSFEKDVPRVGNAYFWVDDPRVVGLWTIVSVYPWTNPPKMSIDCLIFPSETLGFGFKQLEVLSFTLDRLGTSAKTMVLRYPLVN